MWVTFMSLLCSEMCLERSVQEQRMWVFWSNRIRVPAMPLGNLLKAVVITLWTFRAQGRRKPALSSM